MDYKEIDDKTLKILHKEGLEILKEIDRVCQKYDIPYFLCGGTLIGVMRHKGFIPWDDDIDVGMLRKDYEKFQKCFIKEHSKEYFLQSIETEPDYWLSFMKIRKNNTTFIEGITADLDIHHGIYVDIFPFDEVPDNGFDKKLKLRAMLIKVIKDTIYVKKKLIKYSETRRTIFCRLFSIFSVKKLFKIQKKLMTKYENKGYKHCICYIGTYPTSREYIAKDTIYPVKKGLFEKEEFSIPNTPEVYLTNLYGDFMKLPPKDKRRNHAAVKIDFKKGTSKRN